MLAESADESDAAAIRCMLLRADLSAALREALAARPETAHVVGMGMLTFRPAPPVRIEVRGTAARRILCGAFSIGSDPLCDVQAFGDASVLPLQCVIVSLPGGLVVIDAWSSAGPRMAWQCLGPASVLVESGRRQRRAVVVPHGDRAVFSIGDRTTFALGPPAEQPPVAADAKAQEGALASAAAMELALPRRCLPSRRATAGNTDLQSTTANAPAPVVGLASPLPPTMDKDPSTDSTRFGEAPSGNGHACSRLASRSRCFSRSRSRS